MSKEVEEERERLVDAFLADQEAIDSALAELGNVLCAYLGRVLDTGALPEGVTAEYVHASVMRCAAKVVSMFGEGMRDADLLRRFEVETGTVGEDL